MTTTETSGLIGSIKSFTARLGAGPLMWIVRLVLLAGFLLILKKAKGTPDQIDAAILVCLGMATLASEYYMGGETVRAWFDRAIMRLGAVLGVYGIVLGYAVLQWTGSASEMEATKTGATKAAFIAQEDTSAKVAELTIENNKLLQKIQMAPVRGPEAADAAIKRAKADRFWGSTAGCTETKGPQTRKFCDDYTSAVADREYGKNIKVWEAEQKVVAAELTKLRDGRKNQAVVAENRSDLRFLVAYAGMTEQSAADLSAAWKIAIISVLVFVLGILVKAESYRDLPRKPWGFAAVARSIVRWFKGALYGRDAIKGDTYIIDDTKTREAAKQAFARYGATA